MRLAVTQPLFAWEGLEDGPSLQTVWKVLAVVPDDPLVELLRRVREPAPQPWPS